MEPKPADTDSELQWRDRERFLSAIVLCLVFFFFDLVEHWSLCR
jgi:hypothetical protein